MIARILDRLLRRHRCEACGEPVPNAHRAGHWAVNHIDETWRTRR